MHQRGVQDQGGVEFIYDLSTIYTFRNTHFQTQSLERNIYMYRSYIAQKKYRVVLDEIDAVRMPELVPIRYIAEYFAFPDRKAQILTALEKHELDADELSDMWALSFAYIHYSEENYSEALR